MQTAELLILFIVVEQFQFKETMGGRKDLVENWDRQNNRTKKMARQLTDQPKFQPSNQPNKQPTNRTN